MSTHFSNESGSGLIIASKLYLVQPVGGGD